MDMLFSGVRTGGGIEVSEDVRRPVSGAGTANTGTGAAEFFFPSVSCVKGAVVTGEQTEADLDIWIVRWGVCGVKGPPREGVNDNIAVLVSFG